MPGDKPKTSATSVGETNPLRIASNGDMMLMTLSSYMISMSSVNHIFDPNEAL